MSPTKPQKYRPAGALPKGAHRFRAPESTSRQERQQYYQSYDWRKFRNELKTTLRQIDELHVNNLIAKGALSWKDVRAFVLDPKKHPLCVSCKRQHDRYRPAKVLDHIQPFRPEYNMQLCDRNNVQWLCEPCHNKKSQKERYR